MAKLKESSVKNLLKKLLPNLKSHCPSCNYELHAVDIMRHRPSGGISCPSCLNQIDVEEVGRRFKEERFERTREQLRRTSKRQAGSIVFAINNSPISYIPPIIVALFIGLALSKLPFPMPFGMNTWQMGLVIGFIFYYFTARTRYIRLERDKIVASSLLSPIKTRTPWPTLFSVDARATFNKKQKKYGLYGLVSGQEVLLMSSLDQNLLEALKAEIEDFKQSQGL